MFINDLPEFNPSVELIIECSLTETDMDMYRLTILFSICSNLTTKTLEETQEIVSSQIKSYKADQYRAEIINIKVICSATTALFLLFAEMGWAELASIEKNDKMLLNNLSQ